MRAYVHVECVSLSVCGACVGGCECMYEYVCEYAHIHVHVCV